MLSCYDATLSLEHRAPAGEPTFAASYPAMGRMPAVREAGVTQRRLRAAPVRCPPAEVFHG